MLKPRKRLTKKEIKQDTFIDLLARVTDLTERYAREIAIGIGVIILIVVSAISYARYKDQKNERAVSALAEARIALSDTTASGKGRVSELLRKVMDNFGGTASGKEAIILLANIAYDAQRYDEARSLYERYVDKDGENDLLMYAARMGIAACLEQQGKYTEAAEAYRHVAEKGGKAFYAPTALIHAARCFQLVGKRDDAAQILQRIMKDYPGSQAASQAKDEMKML
jgi:TolA-binding protein